MKKILIVAVLCFLFCSQNAANSAPSRESLIAKKLDCLAAQKTAAATWNDVCVTDSTQRETQIDNALKAFENPGDNKDGQKTTPAPAWETVALPATMPTASAPKKAMAVTLDPQGNVSVTSKNVPQENAPLPPQMMREPLSEIYTPPPPALPDEYRATTFELAPEIFAYRYTEPGLMHLKGAMYGISGNVAYRFFRNQTVLGWNDILANGNGPNVFMLQGRFSYGALDYDSETTGSFDGEDNFVGEIRGLLGFDIPLENEILLTPYAGVGYRYLFDKGANTLTTTNNWGYDRESNYFYLPLGMEASKKLNDGWGIGAKLEYDIFLHGLQRSHLADGGVYQPYYIDYPVVENNQDKGYGLRGSFMVKKTVSTVDLFVEPFLRYWNIADSDIKETTHNGSISSGLEPKNNTLEWGIRAGVKY